uniref:ATP synthase F0 subunit 8 n=1 Tax=Vatana ogromna TaxID=2893153 RepID=A0A9E6XQA0_9HEMI|nr:ATP synthase F0 subunit 8 [Vatana ogromna]UGN61410.1 ATP synthase F0 subunit 8 [Vatana ogromna]
MPQMSPMWWTTLMFMFIISFMMYMNIMYFNYNKNIKKNKKELNKLNWMW